MKKHIIWIASLPIVIAGSMIPLLDQTKTIETPQIIHIKRTKIGENTYFMAMEMNNRGEFVPQITHDADGTPHIATYQPTYDGELLNDWLPEGVKP